MNKAGGIGIAIGVIAGIAYSMSSTESSNETIPIVEEIDLNESVEEEIAVEEPEQTGRELSVELSETIGLKSP